MGRDYVKMVQPKKLVELGRVVHITTGPCAGEIGAIVDIIDAKRILVDGPRITRQEIKLKNMFLTRIMLKYNDVLSHKALIELWERNLVDMRYKRTVHAQRLQKLEKRAACTDFEYFKVRCAARSANKIKENALKNLHAKHPRALAKMERSRRINMGVKLGYRTVKTLTDEEKAVKAAREKIIRANMKTKSIEYKKAKKEKRAKIAEARKARNALKKEKREKENKTGADGEPPCPVELGKPGKSKELKPKKRSPKTPKPPRMSSVRLSESNVMMPERLRLISGRLIPRSCRRTELHVRLQWRLVLSLLACSRQKQSSQSVLLSESLLKRLRMQNRLLLLQSKQN